MIVSKMSVLVLMAVLGSAWSRSMAQVPSDLYVAEDGDDAGSGAKTAPMRTIGKAITLLRPGQTLYVHGGKYVEQVVVSASGTQAAPISILAFPGEQPVIDGEGNLPLKKYDPLVRLKGRYLRMDGFEIRNSKDAGLMLDGDHDQASHLNVNHNMQAGVLARGDYSIVEDSTIRENAYLNCRAKECPESPYKGGEWATGLSAARNPIGGITHFAILRRNTAYNNWGEGISSYEADGTVMEDNVSYDNWATNFYISDSSNVLFQRNLAYVSSGYTEGRDRLCIQLADERADKPRSRGNVVINNMCMNGSISAFAWTGVPQSGLVDDLIANNTIINGGLKIGSKSISLVNSKTRIVNNIFFLDGKSIGISSTDGIEFSNNLWSIKPPDAALGTGSIIGNSLVAKPDVVTAGKVGIRDFVPPSSSPARRTALVLSKAVPADALGHPRGARPSIGAIEILP